MNFNALSANEKLAVYAAVAAIVGTVIASFIAGSAWLTLLAGLAMLAIVFLPQFSSGTQLPGSKGTLMVTIGAVGAAAGLLALVAGLGLIGFYPIQGLFLLLAVVGGLVMAWAGWQELQSEGGSFRFGAGPSSPPTPRTPPATPPGTTSSGAAAGRPEDEPPPTP